MDKKELIEIKMNVEESLKKTTSDVKEGQTSCRVHLPKDWQNRTVLVCLLPKEEENKGDEKNGGKQKE